MFPPLWTAASSVPSLEEVMLAQSFALPTEVPSVHVAPESAEVQMVPLVVPLTAASLVPSLEEVMPTKFCASHNVLGPGVCRVGGGPDGTAGGTSDKL